MGGKPSELSLVYRWRATPNWRKWFRQAMPWALDFAPDRAGSSMEASTAMMAITTSNSISVNPTIRARFLIGLEGF